VLIIVYLLEIASDIKSKKEHPPTPLKRGIGFVVYNIKNVSALRENGFPKTTFEMDFRFLGNDFLRCGD